MFYTSEASTLSAYKPNFRPRAHCTKAGTVVFAGKQKTAVVSCSRVPRDVQSRNGKPRLRSYYGLNELAERASV